MEFLFGILFIAVFVLSGPSAFIWCRSLSSRIRRLEEENESLLRQLRSLQREKYSENPRQATRIVPPEPAVTPSPEPLTIPDPAERCAAVWAQSVPRARSEEKIEPVPVPPLVRDTEHPVEEPARPEPAAEVSDTVTPPEKQVEAKRSEPSGKVWTDEEWEKTHPPAPVAEGGFSWQSWELWIGRKFLGWVAVGALILSATLFIKVAVDEGWIGRIPPQFRVLGIAFVGGLFLAAGKYFQRIAWRRFSTMLSSAGILILFQAGYATYAFYDLVSLSTAGLLMSFIVLGSFLLSWHYESKLLGIISIAGGLAVPLLLASPVDRYVPFFTYLIILNVATVMLVNLLCRAPIGWIAFFGTQAEFWLWHGEHYVHPDKLAAVLLFQGAFYLTYLLDTSLASMIPQSSPSADETSKPGRVPTWDDAMRAILAPIILFGTIWILLRDDPVFSPWLGILAFAGAAWYALLAVLYGKQIRRLWDPLTDRRLSRYWKAGPTAATVIALGFVAIAIPLQLSAPWIALGWTVVFAGLWYFGHRQGDKTFLVMARLFAVLAAIRLLNDIFDYRSVEDVLRSIPVLNESVLPALVASIVVMLVAALADRLPRVRGNRKERDFNAFAGLVGYAFFTTVLSVEIVHYFRARPTQFVPYGSWSSISLTILWSLLAMALMKTGSVFRSGLLRNTGALGLLLVAGKVVFADFLTRSQFSEPIWNPASPGLVLASLLLIYTGVRAQFDKALTEEERPQQGVFALIGVFTLLAILSVECFHLVRLYPDQVPGLPLLLGNGPTDAILLGWNSLSILWTFYAGILLLLGFSLRSPAIRACGLVVLCCLSVKIGLCDLVRRPDYPMALLNPYFLSIFFPVPLLVAAAVQACRLTPLEKETDRRLFSFFGVVGIVFLWVILSVECFLWFRGHPLSSVLPQNEATVLFVAISSLTVLWTGLALVLIGLGIACRSSLVRYCALVVFGATMAKILFLELFRRPAFESAILNPYYLPICLAVAVMIALGVYGSRRRAPEYRLERPFFTILGLLAVCLIWASSSVECFQYFGTKTDWPNHRFLASASLTVFWTVLAIVLAGIAAISNGRSLRILSVGLLLLTVCKAVPLDLFQRPPYVTPMMNPYAAPLTLLAIALVFVCLGLISRLKEEDREELMVYRFLSFAGVVFLWGVLSLECFRSVRLLQHASEEAWKAQMALSILWSLFAGALIFIGFVWRSAVLRWMAILLFGVTVTKVLIVDMSGVHGIYRFGAVFILAVILTLAAWAYQRFKPGGPAA